MYLPLPEVEGRVCGMAICLAVNAIIYHMSPSITANCHGPFSSVPIIYYHLQMKSLSIFKGHFENYLTVEQELLLQPRGERAHKRFLFISHLSWNAIR